MLTGLVQLCREHEVLIVSGTYAMPVWIWGMRHVLGADYRITHVIHDPDHVDSLLAPGYGYIAMNRTEAITRELFPNDEVIPQKIVPSSYNRNTHEPLRLRDIEVAEGNHVAVHAYTRHAWKNCNDAILQVNFRYPVQAVGIAGEIIPPKGWRSLPDEGASFDDMTKAVLSAKGFVGVLSSFTNLAALFQKRQIVATFTEDVLLPNPDARILLNPHYVCLQRECEMMGF